MTEIQIFMAGFASVFAFGLLCWGAQFVRALVGGGFNE